jgi:hypothetical protein
VEFNWAADGIQATGSVGSVAVGDREIALTGVEASGLIGDEVPVKAIAISGVSASGAVGNVIGQRLVAVTGSQAMGNIGSFGVFYWSLIDDSETANWQNISTV